MHTHSVAVRKQQSQQQLSSRRQRTLNTWALNCCCRRSLARLMHSCSGEGGTVRIVNHALKRRQAGTPMGIVARPELSAWGNAACPLLWGGNLSARAGHTANTQNTLADPRWPCSNELTSKSSKP